MRKIEGNLEITRENENDFSDVTEVTGYVYVYGNAKLSAPLLTTVGGYVDVYGNAKLPALTTVGGYVYVRSNAKLSAPILTTDGVMLWNYFIAEQIKPSTFSPSLRKRVRLRHDPT